MIVTIVVERIKYDDEDGKIVTESFRTYVRKTFRKKCQSLDDFLQRWSTEKRKSAIIQELDREGRCAINPKKKPFTAGNSPDGFSIQLRIICLKQLKHYKKEL